jgi:hypothetical protein
MGDVVAFKVPATPKRRIRTEGETAEILFFTGVRYVPVPEQAKLLRNIRRRRQPAAKKQAR